VATITIKRIKFAHTHTDRNKWSLSVTIARPKPLRYLSVLLLRPSKVLSFSSRIIIFSFWRLSSSAEALPISSTVVSFYYIPINTFLDLSCIISPACTTYYTDADSRSINSAEGLICTRLDCVSLINKGSSGSLTAVLESDWASLVLAELFFERSDSFGLAESFFWLLGGDCSLRPHFLSNFF
jgi:hypothetical protein